jgi:hypothetical protein
MKAAVVIVVTVFILSLAAAVSQQFATASPYEINDAYEVYSVLLPREESYGMAERTLVIQQDTAPVPVLKRCFTPEAAGRFKDAIVNYKRVNDKPWLLQRWLRIEKDYKLVTADTIKVVLQDGWDGFYRRYPGSGGYFTVSAVGFNEDKTLAVVHTGSSCGSLCGLWGFHLLEKVDGKWRQVPGAACVTVS